MYLVRSWLQTLRHQTHIQGGFIKPVDAAVAAMVKKFGDISRERILTGPAFSADGIFKADFVVHPFALLHALEGNIIADKAKAPIQVGALAKIKCNITAAVGKPTLASIPLHLHEDIRQWTLAKTT
ncbi:MAG: hypothetical protein HOA08_07675 [Rhodospirillaceae bacterium]|nr:hypothetical protein [Rhodospirillaceae bacterium]